MSIKQTFVQYWYRESRHLAAPPASWWRQCLRNMGRGLECQWMRD